MLQLCHAAYAWHGYLQEPWEDEMRTDGWTAALQKGVVEERKRPTLPPAMPAQIADLIQACWKTTSRARPTMQEVVEYLQGLACAAAEDLQTAQQS